MKNSLFSLSLLTAIVALGAGSLAQDQAAPITLAPGTLLSIELSKTLDARKSKPNDRVEAKTATDLLVRGQIVLPRETKIVGRVTESKARGKDSPNSLVGIAFDRIVLKDRREVPVQLAVQAVARPLQVWSPFNRNGASEDPPAGVPPNMVGRAPIGGSAAASGTVPAYPSPDIAGSRPDPVGSDASTSTALSPTSRGVIGIRGLAMATSGPATVFTSATGNVHLEGGTQMSVRVQ